MRFWKIPGKFAVDVNGKPVLVRDKQSSKCNGGSLVAHLSETISRSRTLGDFGETCLLTCVG